MSCTLVKMRPRKGTNLPQSQPRSFVQCCAGAKVSRGALLMCVVIMPCSGTGVSIVVLIVAYPARLPPPLLKHGLVQARRPRLTVVSLTTVVVARKQNCKNVSQLWMGRQGKRRWTLHARMCSAHYSAMLWSASHFAM